MAGECPFAQDNAFALLPPVMQSRLQIFWADDNGARLRSEDGASKLFPLYLHVIDSTGLFLIDCAIRLPNTVCDTVFASTLAAVIEGPLLAQTTVFVIFLEDKGIFGLKLVGVLNRERRSGCFALIVAPACSAMDKLQEHHPLETLSWQGWIWRNQRSSERLHQKKNPKESWVSNAQDLREGDTQQFF